MWGEGEVNSVSTFQVPSLYGLGVKVFCRYFHKGSVTQYLNESINDKAGFRIAQATPGLSIILAAVTIKFGKIATTVKTVQSYIIFASNQ